MCNVDGDVAEVERMPPLGVLSVEPSGERTAVGDIAMGAVGVGDTAVKMANVNDCRSDA